MSIAGRVMGGGKRRARKVRARRAQAVYAIDTYLPPPTRPKTARRPRRRFEVALSGQAGAGVQLPSVPVVRPGPRLLSGLLLAIMLLLTQRVVMSPTFVVDEAEVTQTLMLPDQLIRSLIGVDRRPVWTVDPAAIKASLEAQPEIARTEVLVRWPNRVVVGIQERHPIVSWNDAGRVWWISSEGVGYLAHGDWPGLIKISSAKPILQIAPDPLEPVISSDILRAAGVLSAQLPPDVILLYHGERGLGFKDGRGWDAYFGVDGDMVLKFRLYQRIADALHARGIQPAMVSVEDLGAPYYREKG